MNLTIYVSEHCPESQEALKILRKSDVPFRDVDITANLTNLKEFMKLREEEDFFLPAKEENRVGIPVLMFGDREKFLDVEDGLDLEQVKSLL